MYCPTLNAKNNGNKNVCMNRADVTVETISKYGSMGSNLQRENSGVIYKS